MKKLTAEEWQLHNAKVRKYKEQYPKQRHGQAHFNVLYMFHKDLANSVRGTSNDPFYKEELPEGFIKAVYGGPVK
jgi:hypothetical protein